MITIAIFNSIVVFFASLAKSQKSDYWLKLSFILIFLFLALRYNYGNDYWSYVDIFNEVDHFDIALKLEPGWQILCLLFKPLGFFAMIAFLAAFNCLVYYHFIKKYVPSVYYWFAVFLYVFDPYLMLVHSSAMRQSIAISLFLISIDYIYKKEVIRFVISILVASLFHQSALILLPIGFVLFIDWKITKTKAIILLLLFMFMFLSAEIIAPYLKIFINSYFQRYEVQQIRIEFGTGLGLLYIFLFMALLLFYSREKNKEETLLFKIVILQYYIIPLGFIVGLIGRVGMYMYPVLMPVIPIMLLGIKDKKFKNIIISSYTIFILYSFYIFFQSPLWKVAFGKYNTILLAPKIY